MRENFEFALRQVKPGFVLALGGDDALLPGGIRGMLEVLTDTGQELLAWPAPVFQYPGFRAANGLLRIGLQRGRRIIRSADFLRRQVSTFDYNGDIESPMFYVKGVASTRLVDRVRSRSADGRFYGCATPDGYSGIVLAGEVSTYAFSGEPFAMHGVSPTSTGAGYLRSDEGARTRSEAFFREAALRPMHRELGSQPYSPLISLMTADYVLSAQDLPGWPGSVPPIDYRRLLERALQELAHGFFSTDRIPRELQILDPVAEHHGLGEFFRRRVRASRRFAPKAPLDCDALSRHAIFIACASRGIENVFDAALYAHRIPLKWTVASVTGMILNSLRYRLASRRKGSAFPPESEWHGPTEESRQSDARPGRMA